MATYISLLRGINMTGHNSLKMADLTALFMELGYSDVTTYIQSGNVIFNGPDDIQVAEASIKIEKAINEKFGYDIPAIIKTVSELKEVIVTNPYLEEATINPSKMAVLFLNEKPSEYQFKNEEFIDNPPDKFEIYGKEIYILS